MAICRRTTSPIAIVFMVIFIIILVMLLIAVGYTTYNNYYIVTPKPTTPGEGEGTETNFITIEGMDLSVAELSGSMYVNDLSGCENLLAEQTGNSKAAVYDSDTKYCSLKSTAAGSGYLIDSSKTIMLQKAPVGYLVNWNRTAGSDIQGSEIFCSALIGSQERAASLCANDNTCVAYTTFTSSSDGVNRGCIKSATSPLITNTTETNMVAYTKPDTV